MLIKHWPHLIGCLLQFVLAAATCRAGGDQALPESVSFNDHIRPIFAKHCVACHGGVKQASGLSFIYRDEALAEADSGLQAIVPGDAEASYLLERVGEEDPDMRMPPVEHGPALTDREIDLLTRWIEQGAKWEEHWAFVAPVEPQAPQVQRELWVRDPLDRFVLARLEERDMQPSAEATKAQWLRRVSLDLTGLPPTIDDYQNFAMDNRTDAYQRVVDRLTSSPAYGERWASMWLDLARYADTKGYEKDPHRNIWPYRDWLIRAFNDDMPYDDFTVKQLAGDLLPDATLADRLATTFHRNTQTNTEGGTDDEEFRTVAVIDRVNTTWQVWNATTFRCIQCHSHPYDPFRHEEYYKFLALLNTTRDVDVDEEFPLVNIPNDPTQWDRAAEIDARIGKLQRARFDRAAELADDRSQWQPLLLDRANSTGQTELSIRADAVDRTSEVVAGGTISANTTYTLEAPLPNGMNRVTALRIDALPMDLLAAVKTSEMGFVVSRLHAEVVADDGQSLKKVEFASAICDEPHPTFDPADSLRDNNDGWADYTRMSTPRWAVFFPSEPVNAPPHSRLRLRLAFNRVATGNIALCIRRGRFAVSNDRAWTELAGLDGEAASELAALENERDGIAGTATPVMAELADHVKRRSFVFTRGNWLDKDAEVTAGVPESLGALPTDARADRLAMARWLVAPEHPLTARVMVNRLWAQLFGLGIVETVEDFGTSGTLPAHPELLDHLALRFQDEHRWSMKRLLRDIVLSATYRQSSRSTRARTAADPQNRWLGRGPRQRLTAEMVRDQALLLSGKLSSTMYGPPVMPPQPEGIWRSVYSGETWKESTGEDRYRRAVYTYWKRTSGYPSFMTFDMPSREVCSLRRITTNTPLQALASLNDEALFELARALAERMAARLQQGQAASESIRWAYKAAMGRNLAPGKLEPLTTLYDRALRKYDGEAPDAERFALTVVANALLNLDEVLSR